MSVRGRVILPFAVAVVAGLLWVANPWEVDLPHYPDNDSNGRQRYLDNAGRFEISYPRDWFQAESSLTPNLSDPSELFSVASFPLVYRETECAHMPKGALDVMGSSDVFVSVQERKALGSDFEPRPQDFSQARKPTRLECIPENLRQYWIRFKDAQRRFYALLVFGPSASLKSRELAWAVLNDARFWHKHRSAEPLDWPAPFVPGAREAQRRTSLRLVFPDKTSALISYPSDLALVKLGVQPGASYLSESSIDVHEIVFVNGPIPEGLLEPKTVYSDETPMNRVIRSRFARLLGARYALVRKVGGWNVLIGVAHESQASTVMRNIHLSVTQTGFPSVFASQPLALARGGGQERVPKLDFGDANPLVLFTDPDPGFRVLTMGPTNKCPPPRRRDRDSYRSMCLEFTPGGGGIFVTIDGPRKFRIQVVRGLRLEID